jgi:hypothetical protein
MSSCSSFSPSSRNELVGQLDVVVPAQQLVGPARPRPAGVQQHPNVPAMLGGERDRPNPLDQELTRPLPLGPVGEQRLPLLEGRRCGC